MPRIVKRPAAKRDLTLHFVWLAEQGGIEVAQRFRCAAEAAFQTLAEMPEMGPIKVHEGKFAGVRMWRVPGFQSHLIFYQSQETGVAIERVIHAKHDYQRVLT